MNHIKNLLMFVFAGAVFVASATNYYWIGQSGANWGDDGVWGDKDGNPISGRPSASSDNVYFNPGAGVDLFIANGTGGAKNYNVQSGRVFIGAHSSQSSYFTLRGASTLTVADGASLSISNQVDLYNANSIITKSGSGNLTLVAAFATTSSRQCKQLVVNQGTLILDGGKNFACTNIVVAAGATCLQRACKYTNAEGTRVDIAAGGRFASTGTPAFDFAPTGTEGVSVRMPKGETGVWLLDDTSYMGSVSGTGTATVNGDVGFSGTMVGDAGLTLALAENATLTLADGQLSAGTEKNSRDAITDRRLPQGVPVSDATFTGTVAVDGGRVYLDSDALPKTLALNGGVVTLVGKSPYGEQPTTAQNPGVVALNGGCLQLSGRNGANSGNANPFAFPATGSYVDVTVGAMGGTLATVENGYNSIGASNVGYTDYEVTVAAGVKKATGVAVAGPLTIAGWAKWNYKQAFDTLDEIRFTDGIHRVDDAAAFEAANGAFWGAGSLALRNANIGLTPSIATTTALKLATASGAKLTYDGSAVIALREAATDPARSVEIGAVQRAGKGSALILTDAATTLSVPDGSSATIATAPTVNYDDIVLDPIYHFYCVGNAPYVRPLKWTSISGFAYMGSDAFTENTFAEGKYARISDSTLLQKDSSALGLLINHKLDIQDGKRLTLGDGTHPALLTFGNYETPFKVMTGVVDFGTSEGVVMTASSAGSRGNNIGCILDGSNGISFVGIAEDICTSYLHLNQRNVYTGGTFISAMIVSADAEGCLSSGPVLVKGGEMAGGAIWFGAAATYANDFTVGGFGHRIEKYNKQPFGALVFQDDVTLSGNIVLTEPTRMCVWTNAAANAKLSGTVSGDRLIAYSQRPETVGVLELAGHNTYAGGTEIVRQSVAIREADGFGTGAVRVDDGAVIFRNAQPLTLANPLSGSGKIRLEGAGVTLSDADDFTATAYEITPGEHAFTSDLTLRPLVGTGATGRQRSVLVLKAGGAYTLKQSDLDGYFEIVLEEGATLTIGPNGESQNILNVYRFTGNRSAVTGTIEETNPKGGLVLIVR